MILNLKFKTIFSTREDRIRVVTNMHVRATLDACESRARRGTHLINRSQSTVDT